MPASLYLTPADQGRPLTLEEFEKAQGQEGYHYELIEGKLEVSPIPNLPHEFIRGWLDEKLRGYCRRHPEVINHLQAPARVFVPERRATTAPEPDLAAYADFPLGQPLEKLRWQGVTPVLVVEILSEDTSDKDLVRNLPLYLEIPSVREYWIIDPRANPNRPTLTVYRRRGRQWQKPIEVAARGSYSTKLLPAFTLVLDPHR
jgi:Uma2 family endonuclease